MCVLALARRSGKENRLAEKVLGNSSAPAGCLQDLARVADKQSRLHRSHNMGEMSEFGSYISDILFVAQQISQITFGISNPQWLTLVNIENEMFA